MNTLKITACESIGKVEDYEKTPIIMKYVLNSHISIDVTCPFGWTMKELPTIIAQSFIERPVTVHLISITPDTSALN